MTNLWWQALGSGFLMQMGMIMSLGMQNMYVIRKGLRKEYPLWIALTCSLCELVMILIGVLGAGALFEYLPGLESCLPIFAMVFLLVYGGRSILSGIHQRKGQVGEKVEQKVPSASFKGSLLAAVGFSILNPQAILECLVFFGGAAPKYGDAALYFAGGAIIASFVWLFSLAGVTAYGLRRPPSTRTLAYLEILSGGLLCAMGVGLLAY